MTNRGLIALSSREVNRVLKLWTQTVLAPILSSSLFILVFGLSLGDRIKRDRRRLLRRLHRPRPDRDDDGPGRLRRTTRRRSSRRASTATSTTCSPRRCARWQVNLALNVGGAVRALLIGCGLLAVALPLTGVPVHAPLALVAAIFLLLVLFCTLRRRRRRLRGVVGSHRVRHQPRDPAAVASSAASSTPSPACRRRGRRSRAPTRSTTSSTRSATGSSARATPRSACRSASPRRSPRCRWAGACGCSRPAGGSSRSADAAGPRERPLDQEQAAGDHPRDHEPALRRPRSRAPRTTTADARDAARTAATTPCGNEHDPADGRSGPPRARVPGSNARTRSISALARDVERHAQAVATVGDRVDAAPRRSPLAVALAPCARGTSSASADTRPSARRW